MPSLTLEQKEAVYTSGSNIIVSAGAGSGKTSVLTKRVIEKLNNNIRINELLILTFTNAAAGEMKNRIREEISSVESLKENLDLLESSYITTFDSFTLSLVKKYNYLLNVSNNISIVDNNYINQIKEKILDDIFESFYEKDDDNFNKLINDFCVKNDKELRLNILKIIKSLELLSNKEEYLDNYLNNNFNKEYIDSLINEYFNLILDEIKNIETNLYLISESDFSSYYENLLNALSSLIKSKNYDEAKKSIDITLPKRPRESEEIKEYKDQIDLSVKTLKNYLRFASEDEIIESFNIAKDYIKVIIEIIKDFNIKISEYKYNNDLYEFTDIELMAIKLLKENPDICLELKNYYKEIMVDEYQDTNDLQEEFISLLANNNVYMVGDIKQSIYGFRNANPYIFRKKYDDYSLKNGGIKIDLLKNFRSRKEVLKGINDIFNLIMDNSIGGANYSETHQMIFGNNDYEEYKNANQNYDLSILNYPEDSFYSNEEIEAFIIANDINEKLNSNYEVYDRKLKDLRKADYNDFCIIMDRGTSFNLYKKVFDYLKIPLTIYQDKKLTDDIMGLIIKIKNQVLDSEFKYYFVSIARSYLFEYSDNDIIKIINNNSYNKTDLYNIAFNIAKMLDNINSYELIKIIINDFKFYKNSIKVGNVNETIIRIDNLINYARVSSNNNETYEDFKNYLDNIINSKDDITYKDLSLGNGVKIMNIHKSKGLEFPICYFSGFYKKFNTSDIKDRIIFDKELGIITPFFKDKQEMLITKDLLKSKYNINNISEQIRLLYVALTRAKEKIIMVMPLDEEKKYTPKIVDDLIRKKYNSFLSIINSISKNIENYIYNVDINKLGLSKDYLNLINIDKLNTNSKNEIIKFDNIEIQNDLLIENHASKIVNKIISKEEKEKMEYGLYIHSLFENSDFLHSKETTVQNLVNLLNINENTKIYKEHEFIYEEDGIKYHGIIDLILIDDDIKIIDYKLKNIDDDAYKNQLRVYKSYLTKVLNKEVKTYLYSIVDNKIKEILL